MTSAVSCVMGAVHLRTLELNAPPMQRGVGWLVQICHDLELLLHSMCRWSAYWP